MSKNNIIKRVKGMLGGEANESKSVSPVDGKVEDVKLGKEWKKDYSPKAISKDLKQNGLQASETIEVVNPVTGNRSIVTIDRDGTPESKMILALADKTKTRDQKDAVMGMYLFERGKENASFLMDLFRYKGSNTTEQRQFRSQVRFDFEEFTKMFTHSLDAMAGATAAELGYSDAEFKKIGDRYVAYLKSEPADTTLYAMFAEDQGNAKVRMECALLQSALRQITEADKLRDMVERVAKARERERGKGIYIGIDGKSYAVEDIEIDEVMKRDRERLQEEEENLKS